jgi:hypothetical protein
MRAGQGYIIFGEVSGRKAEGKVAGGSELARSRSRRSDCFG